MSMRVQKEPTVCNQVLTNDFPIRPDGVFRKNQLAGQLLLANYLVSFDQ